MRRTLYFYRFVGFLGGRVFPRSLRGGSRNAQSGRANGGAFLSFVAPPPFSFSSGVKICGGDVIL